MIDTTLCDFFHVLYIIIIINIIIIRLEEYLSVYYCERQTVFASLSHLNLYMHVLHSNKYSNTALCIAWHGQTIVRDRDSIFLVIPLEPRVVPEGARQRDSGVGVEVAGVHDNSTGLDVEHGERRQKLVYQRQCTVLGGRETGSGGGGVGEGGS